MYKILTLCIQCTKYHSLPELSKCLQQSCAVRAGLRLSNAHFYLFCTEANESCTVLISYLLLYSRPWKIFVILT